MLKYSNKGSSIFSPVSSNICITDAETPIALLNKSIFSAISNLSQSFLHSQNTEIDYDYIFSGFFSLLFIIRPS